MKFGRTLGTGLLPAAVFVTMWVGAAAGADGPPAKMAGLDAHPVAFSRNVRKCAACHPAQANPQPATSMAHAMETVAECSILRSHPLLTFHANGYSYKIERKGGQSIYSVTDGARTLMIPIGWAFGLGSAGQTYVFVRDGVFYESFVSYYKEPDALDITMGDQKLHPSNLTEAAGRLMGDRERVTCFGCHSTGSVAGSKLTLESLIPGVQCERCHGPTENHLEGLKTGNARIFAMKKLGAMSAEETNEFCGQCHRTWAQIATNGPHGVLNVRFQPYRLTNSRCYDVDDARIKCTSCHDPHREVDKVAADYDVKCLACHGGGKPEAKACKTASSDCTTCHMPKIDLPGAHHRFTDHDIRIVKANETYPD